MRPTDDVPEPDLCVFRAELITLLEERLPGRAQETAPRLIDRLNHLENEARRRGASAATLAAIEGAQALLALSELPTLVRAPDAARQRR